ncbi:methyltransferase domain-containing protein [Acidicapsa ligni]|uniref:methyltransferase domain-containing protein n=1 Tax=Acidicapsa ligni TaxID=542300 RepID=UPI0021DFCEB1|nr:methyltransferase domain-containing protein [Acidicapsa ligni]
MLGKLFDRQGSSGANAGGGPRVPRHSGGWGMLRKRLASEPGLRVLDVGSTSPNNINYLTSLGHSVYMADLIEDAFTGEWQKGIDEDGKQVWDTEGFSKQNLHFSGRTFDMILLWTTLDYLPEALVVPVIQALHRSMEQGGQLIALFHTKLEPEHAPYHRFHITPADDVELQLAQSVQQQRALTNRNIERLFADWSGLKQFLAKDGVSEAIIVR